MFGPFSVLATLLSSLYALIRCPVSERHPWVSSSLMLIMGHTYKPWWVLITGHTYKPWWALIMGHTYRPWWALITGHTHTQTLVDTHHGAHKPWWTLITGHTYKPY